MLANAPALALLLLLAAGAAHAQDDIHDAAHDQEPSLQQSGEDDAHGYQNPTGTDPDPRMNNHPVPVDDEPDDEYED